MLNLTIKEVNVNIFTFCIYTEISHTTHLGKFIINFQVEFND